MLAARPARPRSLASFHDIPVEDELAITRAVARHLWSLLERRNPQQAAELWGEMTEDAKAAADRAFEASMILHSRDRILVEPCRQLLDSQRDGARQYVLTRPTGESEVIYEDKLLMMAGLDA